MTRSRPVVAALPRPDGESLSAFAARVTGRAHALDEGSPLGTLALGAARALAGLEAPGPDESPAEARREAWAAVGVLCDELSSIVLTLGLPGDASDTGRLLAAARAGGEPLWLTLRQLVRAPPRWHGIDAVLVVENPSVIALAADVLGAARRADRLHKRSTARGRRWSYSAHSPPPAFGCATTATSTGAGSRSATSCTGAARSSRGSSTATPICAPWRFIRMPHR